MITCCEIDNNNEIFCAGMQIRPTKNMSMHEKTGQEMIHPQITDFAQNWHKRLVW